MSVSIHDFLASDDHAAILPESTITVGIAAHWHLAVDTKADAAFASAALVH